MPEDKEMALICRAVTVKPLKEVYIDVQRQPDEKLKAPMQRVFHSDMVRCWRERERERERMSDNSLDDCFGSFHSHPTGAVGE